MSHNPELFSRTVFQHYYAKTHYIQNSQHIADLQRTVGPNVVIVQPKVSTTPTQLLPRPQMPSTHLGDNAAELEERVQQLGQEQVAELRPEMERFVTRRRELFEDTPGTPCPTKIYMYRGCGMVDYKNLNAKARTYHIRRALKQLYEQATGLTVNRLPAKNEWGPGNQFVCRNGDAQLSPSVIKELYCVERGSREQKLIWQCLDEGSISWETETPKEM